MSSETGALPLFCVIQDGGIDILVSRPLLVELVRKNGASGIRCVRGDGSYLAANAPRAHFGLGSETEVDSIRVHWLSGGCESWKQMGWTTL
jgi:ASPIC and UnbV